MKKNSITLIALLMIIIVLIACSGNPPVVEELIDITAMSFEEETVDMHVGESITPFITISPKNANTTSSIVWSTSNERVATVTAGKVTAIGHGRATITAKFNAIEATCNIKVLEPERAYKLIWSEEFEGTKIDENKWNFEFGGGGWGNQEKQYYTNRNENARIENGCLVIEARKETYEGNSYTSARLTTKDKLFRTYGKFEARISLPAGKGTWPAFWMMPNKSEYGKWPRSGELDIMEHIGAEPTMISHAVHTQQASGGRCWSKRVYFDDIENNFHTYAVEWINDYYNGNDALIFSVDGIPSIIKYQSNHQTSTYVDWPFDKDFFIILNLAIGGTLGGSIDDIIFDNPVLMKVDWVKVYEQE